VEVLPRSATLSLDGAPLGPGARTVAVPDPAHVYRFSASARGFAPAQHDAEGARLAGARIGLVLRPAAFGEARRLDLDEAGGLAAAAALLERTGQHQAALEYAERSVELAPEAPLGHRVAGDAALALGRQKRAVAEYSAYVQLAPDAADRPAIERRVEELRGDITIPGLDR
jgi:tetratricopeptide (TPR) repeat protein